MDKSSGGKKKTGKLMEVGGILIEVTDTKEGIPPSANELEKQLREGGVDVVEGKNFPEEDEPLS